MQTMTYEEMQQLAGGDLACAVYSIGLAATDIGLAMALPTGGWGVVIATIGMGASLYGVMAGCS